MHELGKAVQAPVFVGGLFAVQPNGTPVMSGRMALLRALLVAVVFVQEQTV